MAHATLFPPSCLGTLSLAPTLHLFKGALLLCYFFVVAASLTCASSKPGSCPFLKSSPNTTLGPFWEHVHAYSKEFVTLSTAYNTVPREFVFFALRGRGSYRGLSRGFLPVTITMNSMLSFTNDFLHDQITRAPGALSGRTNGARTGQPLSIEPGPCDNVSLTTGVPGRQNALDHNSFRWQTTDVACTTGPQDFVYYRGHGNLGPIATSIPHANNVGAIGLMGTIGDTGGTGTIGTPDLTVISSTCTTVRPLSTIIGGEVCTAPRIDRILVCMENGGWFKCQLDPEAGYVWQPLFNATSSTSTPGSPGAAGNDWINERHESERCHESHGRDRIFMSRWSDLYYGSDGLNHAHIVGSLCSTSFGSTLTAPLVRTGTYFVRQIDVNWANMVEVLLMSQDQHRFCAHCREDVSYGFVVDSTDDCQAFLNTIELPDFLGIKNLQLASLTIICLVVLFFSGQYSERKKLSRACATLFLLCSSSQLALSSTPPMSPLNSCCGNIGGKCQGVPSTCVVLKATAFLSNNTYVVKTSVTGPHPTRALIVSPVSVSLAGALEIFYPFGVIPGRYLILSAEGGSLTGGFDPVRVIFDPPTTPLCPFPAFEHFSENNEVFTVVSCPNGPSNLLIILLGVGVGIAFVLGIAATLVYNRCRAPKNVGDIEEAKPLIADQAPGTRSSPLDIQANFGPDFYSVAPVAPVAHVTPVTPVAAFVPAAPVTPVSGGLTDAKTESNAHVDELPVIDPALHLIICQENALLECGLSADDFTGPEIKGDVVARYQQVIIAHEGKRRTHQTMDKSQFMVAFVLALLQVLQNYDPDGRALSVLLARRHVLRLLTTMFQPNGVKWILEQLVAEMPNAHVLQVNLRSPLLRKKFAVFEISLTGEDKPPEHWHPCNVIDNISILLPDTQKK